THSRRRTVEAVISRSFGWTRTVAEAVEDGHAVRLGPHADRARAGDVRVVELDVALAVERDRDARAAELAAQDVPPSLRDRSVDVLDRVPATVLRVVDRHVVLERVGARDIVVIAVLPAPHEPAGLVLLAGKWLEADLDEAVGKRDVAPHAPGKVAASR